MEWHVRDSSCQGPRQTAHLRFTQAVLSTQARTHNSFYPAPPNKLMKANLKIKTTTTTNNKEQAVVVRLWKSQTIKYLVATENYTLLFYQVTLKEHQNISTGKKNDRKFDFICGNVYRLHQCLYICTEGERDAQGKAYLGEKILGVSIPESTWKFLYLKLFLVT